MTEPAAGPVPQSGARRLLYVGTGALGVMLMPSWLYWLRNSYPSLEIRTVITPSALRFVTQTSLSVFGGRPPELDRWSDEPQSTAPHVDLSHWADTVIVHPATFHFTSRFALGAADTPTMLALQCTNAPVALAPALPPGALTSPAWKLHTAALAARKNVTVVPPHPGVSMTTGRQDAATAAPLPEVIHAVETLRTSLQSGTAAVTNDEEPRPSPAKDTPA